MHGTSKLERTCVCRDPFVLRGMAFCLVSRGLYGFQSRAAVYVGVASWGMNVTFSCRDCLLLAGAAIAQNQGESKVLRWAIVLIRYERAERPASRTAAVVATCCSWFKYQVLMTISFL